MRASGVWFWLHGMPKTVAAPRSATEILSTCPIQKRASKAFQDPGPLVRGQVAGHQNRPPHTALTEYLEEQFRASAGEWHEPGSSMTSRLRRYSYPCSFSSRLPSLASMGPCTSAAALVKPTAIPRCDVTNPSP